MRKLNFSFKSLLVAAGLLLGSANAWGDTKNYAQVFKYTFEDAETYQTPWTISAGSATSQFDISGDKYIYFKQNATNAAQTQTLDFSTSVTGIEDYIFSFDFAYCPMGYSQKGTGWENKILTVYASDESELFHLEAEAASGAVDINVINGSGTNIGKFTSGGRYADPTAANVYTITLTGDSENGVVIAIKNVSTSTAVTFSNSTLSASYKLAAKIVNTLQSTTGTNFYSRTIFDDIYFGEAVTGDYAGAPTFALTGFDGTSRIFTITCGAEETIHYTVDGGETHDGASAGTSVNVTVPAGKELVAWTTSGLATSSNTSYTVVGGTPVLTAPTVTLTDIGEGFSKTYTVSNLTQTITEGAYSYNFEPTSIFYATSASATSGTNIADNKFTLSAGGTYYVIVSAIGATSANKTVDNTVKYTLTTNYDFTNAAILTEAWTDASGTEKWVNSGDAEAYKENSVTDVTSSTALFEGFTVTDAGKRHNKMHWHSGKGVQFVNSGGNFTIGLTSVPENAIIRNTYYQNSSTKYELGNTITIGRYNQIGEKQGLVAIDVYTPENEIIGAMDCSTAYAASIGGTKHKDLTVSQGETMKINFNNHGSGVNNYNCWALRIVNSSTSFDRTLAGSSHIVGTDAYNGVTQSFELDNATASFDDYMADYKTQMMNANVEMTITYTDGGMFSVEVEATGSAHTYTYTMSYGTAFSGDVTMELGVDCAWLEILSVEYSTYKMTSSANLQGYKTFYNKTTNYQVDANTTIYKAAATVGAVTLTAVAGNIIPKDTPVILQTTDAGHSITLTATASEPASGAYDGNQLLVSAAGGETDTYILAYTTANGLGFYRYSSALDAGDIYLAIPAGVKVFAIVVDGEATGIAAPEVAEKAEGGILYNTAGQVVTKDYKGIVIKNGKKYIQK